jgi:glyoxylase-like metal-dependent hydrolase (beta-lactamase superfamily II)
MTGVWYFERSGLAIIAPDNPMWPSPANVFIIRDGNGFSIIDAGCAGPAGPDYLMAGLEHFKLAPESLHTVVLSHAHPDHMGGLSYIREWAEPRILLHEDDIYLARNPEELTSTFDIPLAIDRFAEAPDGGQYTNFSLLGFFRDFGCAMSDGPEVSPMVEGDTVELSHFSFKVLHTPGHAPGHVSLFDEKNGILLAGDLVGKFPAWYTPASGGVTGYLKSLDKMSDLDAEVILPSHGPVIDDPKFGIDKIRQKLLDRERIVLEALDNGPHTFLEVLAALFREPMLHFFPGCAVLESHLIKLEADGAIRREGNRIARS